VREALPGARVLIMAAAVADWRARDVARNKLKKGAETMSLDLVPTVDILRSLRDDDVAKGVFVVGFAAETEHVIDNARAKLETKGLDLVVVNDVSREGIGMGADDNEVTVIGRDGTPVTIGRAPKSVIAEAIVQIIMSRLS
jgi:phosphopantothenoylcysteine decarboxylase/phosphopantothenate--cysteine ligase